LPARYSALRAVHAPSKDAAAIACHLPANEMAARTE
jgi:hypothetical protein